MAKGETGGVLITGGSGGHPSSTEDFNPLWISEFKRTNAYEVWERTTDPLLFDIVEPRCVVLTTVFIIFSIVAQLKSSVQ